MCSGRWQATVELEAFLFLEYLEVAEGKDGEADVRSGRKKHAHGSQVVQHDGRQMCISAPRLRLWSKTGYRLVTKTGHGKSARCTAAVQGDHSMIRGLTFTKMRVK
jgi:hypothetical protein